MFDDWLIIVPADPFASPADEAVAAGVRAGIDRGHDVGELDPRVKDAVESGLGVPVRIVWQHL